MLFNIYDYDNQLLEQVEARDSSEAWFKATSLYGNVLDVREAYTSPYLAEGEHWLAKDVYNNWRIRSARFSSKEEWSKEIIKYYGMPITEIPWESVPLNWYEVIREEVRYNTPGYIVRVYSK